MAFYYETTSNTFKLNDVWYQWNDITTTTTLISNEYINKMWGKWIYNTTTGSTLTYQVQAPIWRDWNQRWEVNERRTAEQEAEHQAYLDRLQEQREAESRRRHAEMLRVEGANARAKELLEMVLTPEEREMYERTGEIHVRGQDGHLYVIDTSHGTVHGNIRRTDEHGCRLGTVCVQPSMRDDNGKAIPLADGWVGQYLGLKLNTEEFLRPGNWSWRKPCQVPDVPILGQPEAERVAQRLREIGMPNLAARQLA